MTNQQLKGRLIDIVEDFRATFDLRQDDESLHRNLFLEEDQEYQDAETMAEVADALADCVFVAAGAIIDGFDNFSAFLANTIHCAGQEEIDLLRATQTVYTSNMSKLCSRDEIKQTADKYAALGVVVHFEPVDELDESAGFRVICTDTVTGTDGKEYPAGKLLKSVGYQEPDWSYLEVNND